MENQQNIIMPLSSKQYIRFQFIPFVSPSKELNKISTETTCASGSTLNGDEASIFYKEVISSPSSVPHSKSSISNQHLKRQKNWCVLSKNYNNRLTIFHYAQDGNIEGIKHLVSKDCDLNVQDMYGWTPLMCATFEGHLVVVEYLLKNGSNINIKNKQGQTALCIAVEKNHKELTKLLVKCLSSGYIENISNTVNKIKEEIKYCTICSCSYLEPEVKHESSIPHILSCKKSNVSTFYHIPENNKGFQIMLKKGWNKNQGLGLNSNGMKFPIKTILKKDRTCIGRKKEMHKITHFGPNDINSIKKHNQPSIKLIKQKKLKKWQIQKLERKNRQKEINFRRQFNTDI